LRLGVAAIIELAAANKSAIKFVFIVILLFCFPLIEV